MTATITAKVLHQNLLLSALYFFWNNTKNLDTKFSSYFHFPSFSQELKASQPAAPLSENHFSSKISKNLLHSYMFSMSPGTRLCMVIRHEGEFVRETPGNCVRESAIETTQE